MRARMRTLYVARNDESELKGDCPHWAKQAERDGMTVTTTRVLWVGKAWFCIGCCLRSH